MALQEVDSADALSEFIRSNPLSLVTFSATWCGPCKAAKPALEALAQEYASNGKGIKFGIVYEHNLADAVHNYNVRAFPTYVLFINSTESGRVEGADMEAIQQLLGKAPDLSAGQSLGGTGTGAPLSKEDARAQRLAKLGATTTPTPTNQESTPVDAVPQVEMAEADQKDKDNADAMDVDKDEDNAAPASAQSQNPAQDLDPQLIEQLTQSMGFSLIRAQKGLLYGNSKTIDSAVEWITEHQDDPDVDDPIPDGPIVKAQSYKCNECGKIISSMGSLELHAHKTGHSDFSESTDAITPLTPEEKAKKIAEIKELLRLKRAEREEAEKVDNVDREKARRFMGKEMAKTREQMEAEARKREIQKRKKEKLDQKKERERLRAEFAKDKAERMANAGKLKTKLGADGYNPSIVQYNIEDDQEPDSSAQKKAKHQVSADKIDEYVTKISSYRAGGDGGRSLKILHVIVGNVVDNPNEEKMKQINMDGKAYKTKIKPFVGAKQLLLAVGFQPSESGQHLILADDANTQLLSDTRAKLKEALDKY